MQITSNKKNGISRVVAVINKDSTYKSLKDLKGVKACFTKYESIGWNSFISIMKNMSKENWGCSDIEAIGNFFGDSCVPGLPITERNVPRNLYSLCNKDVSDGDDMSTLSCLKLGLADVVFVNLKNVDKEIDILNGKHNQYKILCVDERLTSKDEACSLAWTTLGSIVAHENITDLRLNEIYSMLLSMDQLFGTTFPGFTPAFSLYGTYDDGRNVIFPEESNHLQLEVSRQKGIRNYGEIVADIIKQPTCSSASNWNYTILLLVSILLIIVFILN